MTTFQNPQQALLRNPVYGVVTGQFAGFCPLGLPLVTFSGQPGQDAKPARTTVDLCMAAIGAELVLQFDQGDVEKPIVLGILQTPAAFSVEADTHSMDAVVDGKNICITAREQLVLRCGNASITLTKAGKVLVHGTYLSSRATGTHRIKGGSVQIN